jgi:hypothetical protein
MFDPKGVTGESPGQRPGFGIDLESQALKGRNKPTQRARRVDVVVGRMCGIAPFQGLGFLWHCCPRALPWAISLCPVGAEDRCRRRRVATSGLNRRSTLVGFVLTPKG